MQLVDVSPFVFAILWTCIALFYGICGTALALQGFVYFYMHENSMYLLANMQLLSIGVSSNYYPLLGGVSLTIAFVHVHGLISMIYRSLRARSLLFASSLSPFENPRVTRSLAFLAERIEPILPPPGSRIRRSVRFLTRAMVLIWRSFGVTHPNYGVVYILRELVQTGLQTYQAYKMSAHVADAWMNHAIVVLLVLSCWSMSLIKHGLRISSTGTSRLLCLSGNILLDFVAYFGFPTALFWPYWSDYNRAIGNFDQHFWYTDVWLIQVLNEWQMLVVTSLWDGFSKFLVAYTITRSLRSIPKLLHRNGSTSAVTVMHSVTIHSKASVSIVPVYSLPGPQPPKAEPQTLKRTWRSRIEHWGHRLLGFWGLVVLALHLQASITKKNTQCLLQVRPWLTPRPVCALMEISCYDGLMSGNASDFNAALDSIDTEWLSYLVIRHCDAVEITPQIRDLSWLMALKLYNSTLLQWDEHAALTQTHHPNMKFVFVAASNMSALPRGLYDPDFPTLLQDLEMSHVNLTSLPSELADVWPAGMFLVLEGFQFPEFPEILTQIQPGYLSIASNNFATIPDVFWDNPHLVFLNLNDNPIRELPTRRLIINALFIVKTLIERIPLWLNLDSSGFELMAGSTPLCDALQQHNVSALGLRSRAEMEAWQPRVNCTPASQLRYYTHFPLVDEAINNPSRIH